MSRLPLLVLAAVMLAAACDAGVSLPPTSSVAPPPSSVSINRSSPDAAVRTFLDHLRAGDCEGVLADLTAAEREDLLARGGGKERVCRSITESVSVYVNSLSILDVKIHEQLPDSATVDVTLRDSAGYVAHDRLSLLREGEDWKIRQFTF